MTSRTWDEHLLGNRPMLDWFCCTCCTVHFLTSWRFGNLQYCGYLWRLGAPLEVLNIFKYINVYIIGFILKCSHRPKASSDRFGDDRRIRPSHLASTLPYPPKCHGSSRQWLSPSWEERQDVGISNERHVKHPALTSQPGRWEDISYRSYWTTS